MSQSSERELLVSTIERFVSGVAGPYEWDDIVCVAADDPEVEKIRQECEGIDTVYPPTRKGQFCSDEGTRVLLQLAARLRGGV